MNLSYIPSKASRSDNLVDYNRIMVATTEKCVFEQIKDMSADCVCWHNHSAEVLPVLLFYMVFPLGLSIPTLAPIKS